MSVLDIPAFILGNSPHLPTDLSRLRMRFTVGVNRILQVFTPTVLLWVDGSFYKECAEQIDASESLLVCDRSVANRQSHIGLETHVGSSALAKQSKPKELCCNANTGCCAARWAVALGCNPVYLLGMDAQYKDGVSDFYGNNPHHHQNTSGHTTLTVMRKELNRLLADFPEICIPIVNQKHLDEIITNTADIDQDELRLKIKRAIE
ncbi:MAG: hypothetical protein KAV00_06795 [Phycisphaerae bacterium]|nr:hypothetical protein [Phycisphaerae bacterium]